MLLSNSSNKEILLFLHIISVLKTERWARKQVFFDTDPCSKSANKFYWSSVTAYRPVFSKFSLLKVRHIMFSNRRSTFRPRPSVGNAVMRF